MQDWNSELPDTEYLSPNELSKHKIEPKNINTKCEIKEPNSGKSENSRNPNKKVENDKFDDEVKIYEDEKSLKSAKIAENPLENKENDLEYQCFVQVERIRETEIEEWQSTENPNILEIKSQFQ